MIYAVDRRHQRRAVGARAVIVKQIQLGNAAAEKVCQHHPRFHIAISVKPDTTQRLRGGTDDIARIIGGRHQGDGSLVAVINFVVRVWAGAHKHADKAAILMLAAQFFRSTFRIGANGLMHLLVLRYTVPKRTATDNLLLRGGKLFQIEARLTAKLARRALHYHVKMFADDPG